jgi:dTDP-4-dehydrorhamnose reductase
MIKDVIVPKDIPKTAVFGAYGFIGSRFWAAYRQKFPDSVGAENIPKTPEVSKFDLFSPDIKPLSLKETWHKYALILAAIPGIDKCENEKELTRKINVEGTLELARQLAAEGIKPVFFSSDNVFDGTSGNYADEAILKPLNEYGWQKAEVETMLREVTDDNYLIIRMSKVFGLTKGDNTIFDEMAKLLLEGKDVRAAYDQIFCPTYVNDVINAVFYLQTKDATGIYNVCVPEKWSRYDMAVAVAKELGVNQSKVLKISLDEIGRIKRPKNASLNPKKLMTEKAVSFASVAECIKKVAENWKKH